MILLPLVNKVPLKELAFPFAFHKFHHQTYDWDRDILPAALRTFHSMWPHLDSMCEMDWYLGPVVKQLFADRPKTLKTDDDITRFRTLQSAMDRLLLSNVEWMTEKLFLHEQPSLKYGPPGIYVNPTPA